METLKKQRQKLVEKKKVLYAGYRQAQQDMRQAAAVTANIDHLLERTGQSSKISGVWPHPNCLLLATTMFTCLKHQTVCIS